MDTTSCNYLLPKRRLAKKAIMVNYKKSKYDILLLLQTESTYPLDALTPPRIGWSGVNGLATLNVSATAMKHETHKHLSSNLPVNLMNRFSTHN